MALELQRYFHAAAEAAQEVLAEQGVAALDNIDVSKLTEDNGTRGLDSPSKMVAINLANGNPIFREKLRMKLEQSGGLHYDLDTGGMFMKRGKPSDGGRRRGSGEEGNSAERGAGSTPSTSERRTKSKSKKVRHLDEDSNDGSEDGRRGGESSLMKRRRKAELSIVPMSSHLTDMGPPDTPGSKLMKYRSGLPSSSGNLHGMLESPLSLEKHVGFESGYPISADTPTLAKLMNLIPPMSKSIGSDLKFDFDEVVQHFHSPRTQVEVAARWGGVASGQPTNLDSTTSIGSIDSVFNFSADSALSKSSMEAVESMYKQPRDNNNVETYASNAPSDMGMGNGNPSGMVFSTDFPDTPGPSSAPRSADSSIRSSGVPTQQAGSAQKLVRCIGCLVFLCRLIIIYSRFLIPVKLM